jgi:putative membrane protein
MIRSARGTLALALLVPALSLAACAKDGGDDQAAGDSAVAPPPATDAAPPAAPAAQGAVTDPQIAAIVVAANNVDIAAGELAKTKGTSPQVKEFANRMVTDHTGVNEQATALVTRLGVTPEDNPTSRQLTQGGEQERQSLQGLSGAAFDKAYVDNEVSYHQTVLDAIDQTLIPNAQNAELKALLEATRPAVAAHLDHAKQLQSQLGGA